MPGFLLEPIGWTDELDDEAKALWEAGDKAGALIMMRDAGWRLVLNGEPEGYEEEVHAAMLGVITPKEAMELMFGPDCWKAFGGIDWDA